MQQYNTQLAPIKLPEYGRNVQMLVNYCKTITDRDRRNACARTIVNIMADIYPEQSGVAGRKNILWDHLAVISNYELDIDYPCEIMKPEELASKPAPLQNTQSRIDNRIYGKHIEELVAYARTIADTGERIRLFELIANQMKRNFHDTYRNATEDDNKIVQDLIYYAGEQYRNEILQIYVLDVKELSKNNQYDPAKLAETKKKKKKKK